MRILCVDPAPSWLAGLRNHVARLAPEAEIACCRSSDEAIRAAKDGGCDVLLTEIDLESPRTDGFVLAQRIAEINPLVNIIFVTEHMDNANAKLALDLHASGYVSKPFDREGLAEQFKNLRHAAV